MIVSGFGFIRASWSVLYFGDVCGRSHQETFNAAVVSIMNILALRPSPAVIILSACRTMSIKHPIYERVGNFRFNPRFHPTPVGWNLGLTREFPTPIYDLPLSQDLFISECHIELCRQKSPRLLCGAMQDITCMTCSICVSKFSSDNCSFQEIAMKRIHIIDGLPKWSSIGSLNMKHVASQLIKTAVILSIGPLTHIVIFILSHVHGGTSENPALAKSTLHGTKQ